MKTTLLFLSVFLTTSLFGQNTFFSDSIEGKVYKTIKIGNQTWMAENLNVFCFRNGDSIPQAKTEEEWKTAGQMEQPAWCYYDNDPENEKRYGKLYNWYAFIDERGLAPIGYHIPSDKEWNKLTKYLGGKRKAGEKMKIAEEYGTNSSGFSGLLGGMCIAGGFLRKGGYGFWWSAEEVNEYEAKLRFLRLSEINLGIEKDHKSIGFSVRCLKD